MTRVIWWEVWWGSYWESGELLVSFWSLLRQFWAGEGFSGWNFAMKSCQMTRIRWQVWLVRASERFEDSLESSLLLHWLPDSHHSLQNDVTAFKTSILLNRSYYQIGTTLKSKILSKRAKRVLSQRVFWSTWTASRFEEAPLKLNARFDDLMIWRFAGYQTSVSRLSEVCSMLRTRYHELQMSYQVELSYSCWLWYAILMACWVNQSEATSDSYYVRRSVQDSLYRYTPNEPSRLLLMLALICSWCACLGVVWRLVEWSDSSSVTGYTPSRSLMLSLRTKRAIRRAINRVLMLLWCWSEVLMACSVLSV